MNCFRCDGKGKYRNEFGMWEKCESCQKSDMTFESATPEPDVNEEGLWLVLVKKEKKKDNRKQKGQKAAEAKQRVANYKRTQQNKKKSKKPKKY